MSVSYLICSVCHNVLKGRGSYTSKPLFFFMHKAVVQFTLEELYIIQVTTGWPILQLSQCYMICMEFQSSNNLGAPCTIRLVCSKSEHLLSTSLNSKYNAALSWQFKKGLNFIYIHHIFLDA